MAGTAQNSEAVTEKDDIVWEELLARVGRIIDGEVFRCIELLSLKEQAQVAELVRNLLREQIKRARSARICATAVVENWHRAVGPLDPALLDLARSSSGAQTSRFSASSASIPTSMSGSGGNIKKRRRAEVPIHDKDDEFLRLCEHCDVDGAISMLEQSCEPERLLSCSSEGGIAALHHAAFAGCEPLAKRLLHARAEVNRKTDYGFTPLIAAAQSQNEMLVTTLLERRAEVNARTDFDGRSALHLAAAKGDMELCRILVDAGADPRLKDRKGSTPIDNTKESCHHELIQLLQMAGRGAEHEPGNPEVNW